MRYLKLTIFLFALGAGLWGFASAADAADRYWVGGTGNWSDDDNHWATSSGGSPGNGNIPTSGDNCIFNSASNATAYTVTVDAAANCADLTIDNPASGVITLAGSAALNIYGSLTMASGMTRTYTGAITFKATSTGKTLTFNSVTMASDTTFNGVGGGWTVQDAWNNGTADITLTNGNLNTNGQTITLGDFFHGNLNTNTLTLGASTINARTWQLTDGTNLTFNADTSTINITTTGATFFSGGKTYNTVTANSLNLFQSGTFANLTITADATGAPYLNLRNNNSTQIITGTLTLDGGTNTTNRLIVYGETPGGTHTLNVATLVASYVDFRDVTGSGAANWNLSAVTGLSGNCGAVSGITFTTATTTYWVGNGGTWTDAVEWANSSGGTGGTGRVPLCQDTAIFDANSFTSGGQTLAIWGYRIGNTDFSAVTNNPSVHTNMATFVSGNLTWGNMTFNAVGTTWTFGGRGSQTLTMNGLTWGNNITIYMPGGTLTMQDALNLTGNFTLNYGTFDANGFNVTAANISITGTATRTLNMGNGTWTATGTSNAWNATTVTGLTLNSASSTIVVSNTTSTGKTFVGGGKIYYDIDFSGDNITVTGSNTFNEMSVNNAGYLNGLKLTAGTTQTVASFTTNGSSGSLAKMISTSTSNATLAKSGGGVVDVNYMDVDYITGTPESTWYVGANSADGGHNVGLIFSAAPSEEPPAATSTPAEKVRGGTKVRGGVKFR